MPTDYRLIIDPPAAGAWNMAVDEALLASVASFKVGVLRFYQWAQPTLSLGYFQALIDRNRHSRSLNCPVVRRSSGGGAIVHDDELTYSLALALARPLTADPADLYRAVHEALIASLAAFGIRGAERLGTAILPSEETHRESAFLCFRRRAQFDVLLAGAKICGSAQRRRRGAVLQHGSVILGRCLAAPELPGIREIAGVSVDPQVLTQLWTEQLARLLAARFLPGRLSAEEHRQAETIARDKYACANWTARR